MRDGTLLRRVIAVVVGVTLGYLSFSYVVAVQRVSGSSMEPTLPAGTIVVVLRPGIDALLSGPPRPRNGDVVVMRVPGSTGTVVKRVVATGGQAVAMRNGVVEVDGVLAVTAAVSGALAGHHSFAAQTVPQGQVFVLGDNRMPLASRDSRDFGPVSVTSVRGRVVLPRTAKWAGANP